MEDNSQLNLDTSSIKQREGSTTSSLTDRNKIPVFSDAFQEVLTQREEENQAMDQSVMEHIFTDGLQGIEDSDIRDRMFLNAESEIVIRNDITQSSVQSLAEVLSAFIMAGILIAVIVAYYGKRRKGERHAYINNKKRR